MKGIASFLAALCISAVSLNSYAISCDTIPQWTSTAVYTKDMQAQQSQKVYKANWWSQNHSPANYSGPWQEWTYQGDCDVVTNRPPVAVLGVTRSSSSSGDFWVTGYLNLDGSGSYDPDNQPISYSWDGVNFSSIPNKTVPISRIFDNCLDIYQTYTLTVKDSEGAISSSSQRVLTNPADTSNPYCRSSSSIGSFSSVSSSSSVPAVSSSSSRSAVDESCYFPNYVAGTTYSKDQLVINSGNLYRCDVAGWCSSNAAWAYAPATGAHWTLAWTHVKSCSANSSSSVVTTSSSSPSISSGSSSSSISNTGLPRHALVGYWHNFNNGSGVIRLADVDNSWDVIVIAFADDVGNGTVAFNLDPVLNKAQFIADVAARRAQGKKVVLSFGGQNGTVTLNNATNVANFVNSTAAIMNEYGFDGIDIDLESGANVLWGAPVIGNIVTAVKQLKQSFPNLYLSMAPEHPYVQGGMIAATGIWGAYLPIIDGLRNELTLLHVQLYNNGGMATPYSNQPLQAGTVDFMVASVKMLVEGFTLANNTRFVGLRPDQVAIGVPSGSRAAGSGFVTITNLNNAVNCLAKLVGCGAIKPNQAYPDFRGVMTWSINWDVADGRPFSVPVNANLDALP
jgi:chitinase